MNVKTVLATSIAALAAGALLVKSLKQSVHHDAIQVALLQTASHPALDAVRDGFITSLKEVLGDQITVTVKNAQGSPAQAHTIARQIATDKQYQLMVAVATPAAMALAEAEQNRPVIIGAVTDPGTLGLTTGHENLSGATDMIDVARQARLITELIPSACTVGILYSAGEPNSRIIATLMHDSLQVLGLGYQDLAVSSETDLLGSLDTLCRSVDVLLIPTDNMMASSISLIAKRAHHYKKPVIVSDSMLIEYGALAAVGINYFNHGKQLAKQALSRLTNKETLLHHAIEKSEANEVVINSDVACEYGITIPKDLLPFAVTP